jgi:O-antigen/teichoic acid export membrane protein
VKKSVPHVIRNMMRLGSGEALARLAGVATVLFLAHKWGVIVVGVYALGQTMAQYSVPFVDFGLRHVGARLVAQYPQATHEIVARVQRRRFLMTFALLPCLLAYVAFTKLPRDLKACLFAFAAICALHALSLDWLAWGKEHLRLVGLGRSIVPIVMLVFLTVGRNSAQVLWWLVLGSLVGNILQGLLFWGWWRRQKPVEGDAFAVAMVRESLAWQRTGVLGFATLCNLAFNNVDLLMLGVMSKPQEVGLYSASYRVINQVLYTYYLLTQVLYPHLARQQPAQRIRMLQTRILLSLVGIGGVIAAIVTAARRPILEVLFGRQFVHAAPLLLLLVWAIPLDFLTSYLSNAYIAWGMEKKVLWCIAIATCSNVVMNLIWIPSYGAVAAAANTLICYVIFLSCLALAGHAAKEIRHGAEQLPNGLPKPATANLDSLGN